MTQHMADVLAIGGTWDHRKRFDWTLRNGRLEREVLDARGWRVLRHPDAWDHAEHGLLAQALWGHLTGRDDGADWLAAGRKLAAAIYDRYAHGSPLRADGTPVPLVIAAHSHGNQVVAHALDALRSSPRYTRWIPTWTQTTKQWRKHRPVFWLSLDPPVRRSLKSVYESALVSLRMRNATYHGLAGGHGFCMQTRSSGKNPMSWPRYLGARRWPWDASVLGAHTKAPALLVAQPGGHSGPIDHPGRHTAWWSGVVQTINDVFSGGLPVLP